MGKPSNLIRTELLTSGRYLTIAKEGWKKLIDDGYHHPFDVKELVTDCCSLLATDGKKHLGVLQFAKDSYASFNRMYVGICYVRPEFENRGIFTSLWNEFLEVCRRDNVKQIDIATHAYNKKMQLIIENKLKGVPAFKCYNVNL